MPVGRHLWCDLYKSSESSTRAQVSAGHRDTPEGYAARGRLRMTQPGPTKGNQSTSDPEPWPG